VFFKQAECEKNVKTSRSLLSPQKPAKGKYLSPSIKNSGCYEVAEILKEKCAERNIEEEFRK